MKSVLTTLKNLPAGTLTIIVFALICWLTLTHSPLPPIKLPDIISWDKVAHAAMFGTLTAAAFIDIMRKGAPLTIARLWTIAILCSAFGAADELLQGTEMVNRSCEFSDWVADTTGILIVTFIFLKARRRLQF